MLNLPRPTPNFVGRSKELERIESGLHACNIVFLEGPAGSGKTAVALELGERLKNKGRSPIWWRAREDSDLDSLLYDLKERQPGFDILLCGEALLEDRLISLATALSKHQTDLFVDDFHHLPSGAMLLSTLKDHLRDATFVATSRHKADLAPLALVDCLVIRLLPLESEQAESLLSKLLELHGLEEWLKPEPFRSLYRMAGGYPLAIKLLVSLLLQKRATTSGHLDAAHDELYSNLLASLEMGLDSSELDLLRLLSVFRRPVPVEELGADSGKIVEGLQKRLLVESVAGGAFSTHDAFRDYYEVHLSAPEWANLNSRCADIYLRRDMSVLDCQETIFHLQLAQRSGEAAEVLADCGKQLFQAAQYDYLCRKIPELLNDSGATKNTLMALQAEVLALTGRIEQAENTFLQVESEGDLNQQIRALNSRCHLVLEQGLLKQSVELAKQALVRLGQQTGRRPGRVKALNALALAYARMGQVEALEHADSSLEICREINDPRGECYAHYARALLFRHRDEWAESFKAAERAVIVAESAEEARLAFLARFLKGTAQWELGQQSEARQTLERALEQSGTFGDPLSKSLAHLGCAILNKTEQSTSHLDSALLHWSDHGGRVFGAQVCLSAALQYDKNDLEEKSKELIRKGIALAEQAGATPLLLDCILHAELLSSNPDEERLQECRENAQTLGLLGIAQRLELGLVYAALLKGNSRSYTAARPRREKDNLFLTFLNNFPNHEMPDGERWCGPARRLKLSRQFPFLITTNEGSRRVNSETLSQLRDRQGDFSLWLDLPNKIAREESMGEIKLLRKKVVTRLLLCLLRNPAQAHTQEELFLNVWGPPYEQHSCSAKHPPRSSSGCA